MNVGTFTLMVLVACFQSAIAHLGGDVLLDILQEGLLLPPHLVNKAAWHPSKERARGGSLLPLPINRPGLPPQPSSIVMYAFNIYMNKGLSRNRIEPRKGRHENLYGNRNNASMCDPTLC